MKNLLIILLVTLISNTVSASMFYDCLSDVKMKKDKEYAHAKEKLFDDLQECYRFPMGEKYEKCRFQAQLNLEKEQEQISKSFRSRQRACFRENN